MSTLDRRIPWIIKYRPRRIDDVVNQDNAKTQFIQWIKTWIEKRIPDKKAALLYGPAGCGKTSLVEAVANEYRIELVEMNASDFRRREDIERIASVAARISSLFTKMKIILLDEVDGINPRLDFGAVDAILDLIDKSRYPVVMTANDPWSQSLKPLRDVSLMIGFKRLSEKDVVFALKKICQSEKITCEDSALNELAKRSEGDLRSAINDLQSIAEGYGKVVLDSVKTLSAYRDREYAPFEALLKMFNAKYIFQAKQYVTQTNIDHDTMIIWINEHIPTYYEDIEEISRAYDALSRADVYRGRIIKSGSWDLLSYVIELMGAGVAFARKTYKYKWKGFKSPARLQLLAQTKKTREVLNELSSLLAKRLLTSTTTVKREVVPYLRVIFMNNPEKASRIAVTYGLNEEMIKLLAGPRASDVLNYVSKIGKSRRI